MSKSILIGSLVIGAAVLASPFIFDKVKTEQLKAERQETAKQTEIADVIGLGNAADIYLLETGKCPEKGEDLLGKVIKRLPRDRYGLDYITNGDCKFESTSGLNSESY
ncbi:hypothetical protein P3381_25040 [Vibrio parahaemolyticus]|nr:hypothetical protein [Vibrio parahaemolyticus]